MAQPGRRPKPTHLKIIEGNPGQRPLNRNEPMPVPVAPEMPDWLSPYAREEWVRIVPELETLGLIGRVDRAALVVYVEAVSAHRSGIERLGRMGQDVLIPGPAKGEDGQRSFVKNPVMQVIRDQAAIITRVCAEFGMTASARARMVLPDDPHSELADLL